MKKKISKSVAKLVTALAVAALAAACSDGSHIQPGVVAMKTAPAITKFVISKVGGTEAPNNKSVTIESGDSVLLEWEAITAAPAAEAGEAPAGFKTAVSGGEAASGEEAAGESSDKLTLTLESKELGLKLKDLPASGKKVVDDVKVSADFTLTAALGDTPPMSKTVHAVVKEAAQPLEVGFTASPPEVIEDDSTELCWDISRKDASFSIIDSDGNSIYSSSPATEVAGDKAEEGGEVEGGDEAENGAEVVEAEAPNCVEVKGLKENTTYYIDVLAEGSDKVTKTVTVSVVKRLRVESFSASTDKVSGEEEVTLSWKVVPADAVVTIDGIEGTFPAEGSTTVTVAETKTYKINATYGEQRADDSKTILFERKIIKFEPVVNGNKASAENGVVEAGTYFEGEEITVGLNATVEGGTAVDTDAVTLTVSGVPGSFKASDEIKIPVSGSGNYTVTASGDGLTPATATINVNVRKWVGSPAADGKVVSAITPIAGTVDAALIGFRGDLSSTGELYIKKIEVKGDSISSNLYAIPFQSTFEGQPQFGGTWNSKMTQVLDTFPVNSIAIDVSGKLLAGVPAGVVYSDDSGVTWKGLGNLAGLIYNPNKDYPGYHRGCKGHQIKGWKGWEIGGLQDICDVLVDEDGTLYVATSNLVTSLQHGIDAYLNDKKNPDNTWAGTPGPGQSGELTFQTVNHDLEKVGSKLFSASDKGLLASSDKGIHWGYAGGLNDIPVISVTADKVNNKLFVGSEDSLYSCDIEGVSCSKLSGVAGPVYDIKIDPVQVGTVYVATASGVKLSRNLGQGWLDISKGRMSGATSVEKLAISKVGDRVAIFAGANAGIYASIATVKVSAPTLPAGPDESPAVGGGDGTVGATDANGGILSGN